MTGQGGVTLGETLIAVWKQSMVDGQDEVQLAGHRFPVGRTRAKGLRTVSFSFGDAVLEGIEQNPLTGSRWAKLAEQGQRIMQFRSRGRYVANVCEGKLLRYPAWKGQQLPE